MVEALLSLRSRSRTTAVGLGKSDVAVALTVGGKDGEAARVCDLPKPCPVPHLPWPCPLP